MIMTTDSISNSDSYDELTNTSLGVTTDEARDRLKETLFSTLESGVNTIIDAPTSLGKSHLIATTPWTKYPEITGSELIIHIHQTTKARDEAIKLSRDTEGVNCHVLKGREDCCPVAAGKYDDNITAPHGLAPSEWFEWMCDVRKVGFATAHYQLEKTCDLPCSKHGVCPSIGQWWQKLRDEDRNPTVDVVHTTANFAHVEELIEGANVIIDERPDYKLTFKSREREQIRDSISNLLRYQSNGERAISDVETAFLRNQPELEQELRELLDVEVSQDWYFGYEETHSLAPEIGLAILNADEVFSRCWEGENDEKKFARRWMGEYDGVQVVLNGNAKLRHVHYRPDFSKARCVIGLDAFPSVYRWRLNTTEDLRRVEVLSPDERRVWRRNERGLRVVQLGEATRTYTRGWKGAGEERAEGLIRALKEKHGDDFRSCITANAIRDDIRRQMKAAGVENPMMMHYGGQNSRNDFAREIVGLLAGCIDPGDENILDLLALGGKKAWPAWIVTQDGELKRKPNRPFLGPDADIATELLESVRASNLAQAAGRYARKPDSDNSSALVYVWSDACPASLVDERIGVSYYSFTDARKGMIEALREGCRTVREVVEATGSDKSYVNECLDSFYQQGFVSKSEGTGKYGATEWEWAGPDIETLEVIVDLDA